MEEKNLSKEEYMKKVEHDLLKMDRDFLDRCVNELVKIIINAFDGRDLYYLLVDGIEEEEIAEEIFTRIVKLARKAIKEDVKEVI
jgi:EAL domain-containing protein (putative c-di-GMP-specific phosphodiesterase class I)